MKIKITSAIVAILAILTWASEAQTYDQNNIVVETFAGYGIPGYVDGQGQSSAFSNPLQIVSDTASNLYVWDSGNFRVRKITSDGTVSTLAGGGSYITGYGTNVSLNWGTVGTMAIDHANTLWLVMGATYYYNFNYAYLISINTNGYVSISNGDLTNLTTQSGICFDSANNLYYSGGNQIYRYQSANETAQAIVGSGIAGYYDGQGTSFSAFYNPTTMTCDEANNLYVWDGGNERIRKIDQNNNVTTVAGNSPYTYTNPYLHAEGIDGNGTNASFPESIVSMFPDHLGNIYLVSNINIRKMDAQANIDTLAGDFSTSSYVNGPGNLARFSNASGGCFSQGMIFIADAGNNRIRSLSFNAPAQTLSSASLQLNTYAGLQITGTIGRTYQIQSSPDVNTWTTVNTLLLNSSPYLWIDQNPVSGSKFYRAILLP